MPRRTLLVFFSIFAICFLTYSNSLNNNFMMDDDGLILADRKIHNIKLLHLQFIPDLHRNLNIESGSGSSYYRPLAHILPLLCYHFFQQKVFFYHLFNLVLFAGCCFFIYILIRRLFDDERLGALTAVLYAVHPMNGLYINYVTASVFGFQILCMLGGIIIYLKSLKMYGLKRGGFLFFSVILYLLAVFCHEVAIFYPFYLFGVLFMVKRLGFTESLMKCRVFFLVFIVLLALRMKFASLQASLLDKIISHDLTLFQYLASFTKIVSWYLSRLVYPEGIVIKWATPVVKDGLLMWAMIFLCLAACFALAVVFRKRLAVSGWGGVWFISGLLPVSMGCVFQLNYGFILEPHWLFFPSIGLFAVFSAFLLRQRKAVQLPMIVILCLLLIFQSRNMNTLWADEKAYTTYWHEQAPVLMGPVYYLAGAYMKEGNYKEAEKYFLASREDRRSDWEIWNNIGLMAYQEEKWREAEESYQKAVTYFPRSATVQNNLGVLYNRTGKINHARAAFQKAVEYNPYLLEPRLNLANIYRQDGNLSEAEELYRKNLDIDPDDANSSFELINFYFEIHQEDQAGRLAQTILSRSKNARLLTQIGSLFAQNGQAGAAKTFFLKALESQPKHPDAFIELGKLYANSGDLNQAINIWKEGGVLNPGDQHFMGLIDQARQIQMNSAAVRADPSKK